MSTTQCVVYIMINLEVESIKSSPSSENLYQIPCLFMVFVVNLCVLLSFSGIFQLSLHSTYVCDTRSLFAVCNSRFVQLCLFFIFAAVLACLFFFNSLYEVVKY